MSVQFGRWNLDGRPTDPDYLAKVKAVITPYGPDDGGSYSRVNVSIHYRAFHTTKESRREVQPHVTASGAVITWDGRLDNRAELIGGLRDVLTISSTDTEIVAATYEEWGTDCFAKVIGDWALSIWEPHDRSLILAKDPIGTRHLYYSLDKNQITWSTILDPLVLFAGKTFTLNEQYIAGWFSFFPAAHVTPYVGIDAVPPSSLVLIRPGLQTVRKYWDFDPRKQIRYHTDAEYEEHFRTVFAEAVRRRLRSDSPILAELSGGMDSSSVVCMADTIIARGAAETPRLDTISYYDDSEPNWNERPYFTKVEEKRGCVGCHIDVSSREQSKFETSDDRFAATPGSAGRLTESGRQFIACITSRGSRVVLSGIGGDEVTGGVPTPTPELADLLAGAHFRTLAHQLKAWALDKKKPWFHLLFETVRAFSPAALICVPNHMLPAPWLNSDFVNRNRPALRSHGSRLKLLGPLPSFLDSLNTLAVLRRQLACSTPPFDPPCEKRYPYLDRDLLEFIYAIPREQLARPNQRRSLMRRALVGIVPNEILQRKRKAFIVRSSMASILSQWTRFSGQTQEMFMTAIGIMDSNALAAALQKVRRGDDSPLILLMRTFALEDWTRNLVRWRVFTGLSNRRYEDITSYVARKEHELTIKSSLLSAETNPNAERR
jgi:asparagine synthase (glutamine-hydrolysing)